ncbi:response regulator [Pricia sp. S334]|uniref:Response regulator n=1 Tax=Pricia mediterranea TaxID=3076079 RepID=A0ABU3L2J4_9FLAO|nr:response regulator [Pricia sp. S334]MDT7827322.1 response regulator [Pricia sp. S334]
MEHATRILIVEDDMVIAANLSLQLTQLGYEVTGIESRGEEAVSHALANPPDIILMDINLNGKLNGIETVSAIHSENQIPIIYLTANSDETTFLKAKQTRPWAFITKPFNRLNLQRALALVVEQGKEMADPKVPMPELQVLEDRIFIRHNGKMEKLLLEDILYIEADRNYSNIKTLSSAYLLASTLKVLEEKLPAAFFMRVHRSYMVNISKLDVIGDGHLEIGRKVIPISKSYRERLLSRIRRV